MKVLQNLARLLFWGVACLVFTSTLSAESQSLLLRGSEEFNVRGKLSVTWHEVGARHHTGLFREVGGSLHLPAGHLDAKARGKILVRLHSWTSAKPLSERSLVRLIERVNRGPYAVLQVDRLEGLPAADGAVGTTQSGHLVGTFFLGRNKQEVSVPVRLIRLPSGKYLVEPSSSFILSAQRLGIDDDMSQLTQNSRSVQDQLKLFFTFELEPRLRLSGR